jgi:hypothetical protein
LGICETALAAADLAALLDLELVGTLDAAEAAFETVCRLLLAPTINSFPDVMTDGDDQALGKLGRFGVIAQCSRLVLRKVLRCRCP